MVNRYIEAFVNLSTVKRSGVIRRVISGDTNLLRELVFYAIAAAGAYHFSQLRFALSGQQPDNDIYHLMSGTGYTPFQYRVFVPWMVNLILSGFKLFPSIPEVSPEGLFQNIELLTVFLLFIAVRYLVSMFSTNDIARMTSPFIVFHVPLFHYVLPRAEPLWYVHWFPWDIPSVLFITMGLIFLRTQRWTPYYVLFIAATMNRETSICLTFVYLLTSLGNGLARSKRVAFHCTLQFLIWASIKYLLYGMYIDNPAGDTGMDPTHAPWSRGLYDPSGFLPNVQTLLLAEGRSAYPFIASIVGYLWIPVLALVSMVPSNFVKMALIVAVPWWVSGMYIGTLTQLRTLGELLPIVGTAFVLILSELLRKEMVPTEHRMRS